MRLGNGVIVITIQTGYTDRDSSRHENLQAKDCIARIARSALASTSAEPPFFPPRNVLATAFLHQDFFIFRLIN